MDQELPRPHKSTSWRTVGSRGLLILHHCPTLSHLPHPSDPSYHTSPCEAPMPFTVRLYQRFPVQCSVTYHAGPFQGQGTVWNLSCTGWRLSGDLPMRPGETLSLTVTPISFGVVV